MDLDCTAENESSLTGSSKDQANNSNNSQQELDGEYNTPGPPGLQNIQVTSDFKKHPKKKLIQVLLIHRKTP